MALEVRPGRDDHHPDEDGIPDAEVLDVDEPSRAQRMGATARRSRVRAAAAFEQQRAAVFARLSTWFTASDVTDEQLAREVEHRRRRAEHHKEAAAVGRVKHLQAQLRTASPEAAASLAMQLAAAEAQRDLARGDADADRMKVDSVTLGKARWGKKASRFGMAAGGAFVTLPGVETEPMLALAALLAVPAGWWYLGRPLESGQAVTAGGGGTGKVSLTKPEQAAGAPGSPYAPTGSAAAAAPVFDAPAPPALDEAVLTEALRRAMVIKADQVVTVLSAPSWGPDNTATTVFDLPAGVTVPMLQKKIEAFAGALGRDVSMVDVSKAGAAGRVSLWMTDADPFEAPRPSPLMARSGGLDAWKDGIPVAWAKRGNPVMLPVKSNSFVIAGMTRSGKGVGAANLAAGASLDTRINLRIVAGKTNGEWDAYAKAGVASTYFKPNPRRLLALLEALKADMDRRNNVLGQLGKSKLVPEAIGRIGGLELLVIDELATFTRPGKPLRDEILEALIELSAVAAGAGILMVLITQYPEADVIPQGLAMNCGARWAMRVDNATQSNAILGGGASSSGRDASKFDPPLPGLGWLVNPFAGVTDLARSFDLDEDERGEVTALMQRAAGLREAAGRLTGQWEDPIEQHLLTATGLSSAAGGPGHDGIAGRPSVGLDPELAEARDALGDAIDAMDRLGRDAQLEETAALIGNGMTAERLGELLRRAGRAPPEDHDP